MSNDPESTCAARRLSRLSRAVDRAVVTQRYARTALFLVGVCALALLLAVPIIMTAGSRAARAAATQPAPTQPAQAQPAPAQPPVPGSAPELVSSPAPTPEPPPRTGLAAAAADAAEDAASTSTDLAVAVLDRATGEVAVGDRGAEPFYTASLSKVVVAVDMLDRRRLEGLVVTEGDLDLVRQALGPSDDSAMNALWSRFDGAAAAGRVSARLQLKGTTNPRDPSQWGEMSVPAADTVRIWQYILDEMPGADRDLLISAMAAAPPRARDGFAQAFGLLSPAVNGPAGPGAVAKQGWLCCFSGEYYIHTTGAVGVDQRFLVALLTRVPRRPGWDAARQELTGIATAAVQAVS